MKLHKALYEHPFVNKSHCLDCQWIASRTLRFAPYSKANASLKKKKVIKDRRLLRGGK
jgi:hypothetical protein